MSSNKNKFESLLLNNLRAGAVIHKFCDFTTPPKNKFMVVGSTEPNLLTLMINSQVNAFYQQNDSFKYHVQIPAEHHPFLKHDSFTNCIEAHSAFDCSSIKKEVVNDYNNIFKGFLTDECLKNVYHAVKGNDQMRRGHQKEIMASIEKHFTNLKSLQHK